MYSYEKYYKALKEKAEDRSTAKAKMWLVCSHMYNHDTDFYCTFDSVIDLVQTDRRCNRLDGNTASLILEVMTDYFKKVIGWDYPID